MMPGRATFRLLPAAAAAAALAVGGMAWAVPAAGAVPAVTTTTDGGPGSLRAALLAANAATTAIVVDVPPGTYALTRCGAGDDGDLDVTTTAPLTLRAPSGGVTMRQTCAGERVLQSHAAGGRLTLDGVTVTGGSVTGPAAEGGGVWVRGAVVLRRATVTGNAVRGADGADAASASEAPGSGGTARGGGLWVGGSLVTAAATLENNTATGGTGGDTVPGSTRAAGAGGTAEGGGAYVGGAVALVGGRLAANVATGGAGGTADGSRIEGEYERIAPGGGGGGARGGGVAQAAAAASPVAVTGTTTSGNLAAGGGVGAYRTRLVVGSNGAPDLPAAGASAGGAVATTGPLAVAGMTATGDRALGGGSRGPSGDGVCDSYCFGGPASGAARGGALHAARTATVAASTFRDAAADSGEAIRGAVGRIGLPFGYPAGAAAGGAVAAGENLRLAGVTVTGSRARNGAGYPWTTTSAAGGAAHSGAALDVTGGSYAGNTAGRDLDDPVGGAGGAVAGDTVRLTGSTLSGNTAAQAGGAAFSDGALSATRTRLLGNRAGNTGGAAAAAGDLTVTDTRVEGNSVAGVGNTGIGGGLRAGGLARLTRSTVTGNSGSVWFPTPPVFPGAPSTTPGSFRGGGVHADRVVAVAATIAGNGVTGLEIGGAVPPESSLDGGGIYALTAAELTNTTVTGNRLERASLDVETVPSLRAGGVRAPTLRVVHATVAGNVVVERGPGVPERPAADAGELAATQLTAIGTVVVPAAGNRSCVAGVTAPAGSAYDVFGDTTCQVTGAGVVTSADGVALGPLAAGGGPVPTRPPGAGSVLIDAIPAAACAVAADARGVRRPQGAGCDIGAVEVAAN